ncbi:hypothetical protein [Bacillus sp. FSL W8-1141]|uniref:hypothetical protein n=1 Tax=Bacillus sp. FSL W8-1141 TaxID=2954646 RepID=UPI003159300D
MNWDWVKTFFDVVGGFTVDVSHFFTSNAWPLVTLVVALSFKKPLTKLISTLAKIKFKEWELEFKVNQKLDQFDEIVELEEDRHQTESGDNSNILPNNKFKYLKRIKRKSIRNPNVGKELQRSLNELSETIQKLYICTYERFDENKGKTNWSEVISEIEIPNMIFYLREKNIISEELVSIMMEMVAIIPNYMVEPISEEVEYKYILLCKKVREHLDEKYLEFIKHAEKTSS